jgi:arginine-tRNA-protein transferase
MYRLSPQRLDRLLEDGYFRNANIMFQSQVICLDGDIRDVVNVRLPLFHYDAPKRMKKIASKVESTFKVVYGKAKITEEREALYIRHRERFKGFQYRNLSQMLYGDSPVRIFDTHEIAIYDDDRLIAYSFFDVGHKSLASILGVFDPEYKKYSLGLYTMYAEIQWAISKKFHHYYPGYILEGVPQFDYKLLLGRHDFFNWQNKKWEKERLPLFNASAASQLRDKLDYLGGLLTSIGVNFQKQIYPFFSLGYLSLSNFQFYVKGPMHLLLTDISEEDRFVIAEFDADEQAYVCGLVKENDAYREYVRNSATMQRPRKFNEWGVVLEYTTQIKYPTAELLVKDLIQTYGE